MTRFRCAECGRGVEKEPFHLGRVVFGPTCAQKLGLVTPKRRVSLRQVTTSTTHEAATAPRVIHEYGPPDVRPGQLPLFDDEKGSDGCQ